MLHFHRGASGLHLSIVFSSPALLCAFPGTHIFSLHAKHIPSFFHSPCPYVQSPHIGMAVILAPHDGQKSVIARAFLPVRLRYRAKGIHIPQCVHFGVSASYTFHSPCVHDGAGFAAMLSATLCKSAQPVCSQLSQLSQSLHILRSRATRSASTPSYSTACARSSFVIISASLHAASFSPALRRPLSRPDMPA